MDVHLEIRVLDIEQTLKWRDYRVILIMQPFCELNFNFTICLMLKLSGLLKVIPLIPLI